jgi:hypothetical protein
LDRKAYFGKHPWVLADGGVEIIQVIDSNSAGDLKKVSRGKVGITAVTGEDDLYLLPRGGPAERLAITRSRPVVTGEMVRDYRAIPAFDSIWTYGDEFRRDGLGELGGAVLVLWAARSVIRHRKRFGTPMVERGMSWYEWQEIYPNKLETPLSIALAEVATHNHFALDRGGKVFNRTAPVVKLPEGVTEEGHLVLQPVVHGT